MEEHSRVLSILGGIAMSIVGFQICRKVLPWIYANVLGPRLCGPSVNLAEMGEWAGEWSTARRLPFALCARRCDKRSSQ